MVKTFQSLGLIALLSIHTFAWAKDYDPNRIVKRQALKEAPLFDLAEPAVRSIISPRSQITPFVQWGSNNGYCGEVSIIQAAMNQGLWMSQYHSRLICGTGLSQSGPNGFCSAHGGTSNYNAQVLIENPNPGDAPFASAGLCLQNAKLAFELYDYAHAPTGIAGFRHYLSWVKAQTIAGRNVAIAVLNFGGGDPQYDHEVTVSKIGTNHDPVDSSYYDDDVLYFEEHGTGGVAYQQGFTFQSLAKSRSDANSMGAKKYSILIPGEYPIYSGTGGDGVHENPNPIRGANFAFAVSGVVDPTGVTLPTTLKIESSSTNGTQNSAMGDAGFHFERPGLPGSCTNSKPDSWMKITLRATVSNLVPGTAYKMYQYEFDGIKGTGTKAALPIPTENFNAQAALAAKAYPFVASANAWSKTIDTTSDKIIAIRVVRADAP
jgi:hypothetical protein